jgi:hypothetical protein
VHSSITADQFLRQLALSEARNQMGAMLPIHTVLASEGLTQAEYDQITKNPQYQRYVDAYARELQENGFSIQAKSRLLAEDLLPTMYHLAKDPDAPAAARVKIFENFIELADAKPKTSLNALPGSGFSITINIPQVGHSPAQTLVLEAEDAQIPQKMVENSPENTLERPKIELSEPDDYVYAGDDYT